MVSGIKRKPSEKKGSLRLFIFKFGERSKRCHHSAYGPNINSQEHKQKKKKNYNILYSSGTSVSPLKSGNYGTLFGVNFVSL